MGLLKTYASHRGRLKIETNIRTVFIFFFFTHEKNITDRQIHPFVEKTLDVRNPRRWYNALMDYGFMLKKQYSNPSQRSAHYLKQSPFEGSTRQIRGKILRTLLDTSMMSETDLAQSIGQSIDDLRPILEQMDDEGSLTRDNNMVSIQ